MMLIPVSIVEPSVDCVQFFCMFVAFTEFVGQSPNQCVHAIRDHFVEAASASHALEVVSKTMNRKIITNDQ